MRNPAEMAASRLLAAAAPASLQPQSLMEKTAPAAALDAGWNGSHFFVKSREGEFLFQPMGYFQLDQRTYTGDSTATNTFLIRRARLGAQGQLNRYFQYKVEADFADKASTILREASMNVNYSPYAQFKFGQFKVPFSQELLISDSDSEFVERSLAANLVMGANAYSPGVQVGGEFLGGSVQYQAGAFNGRGSLANSDTSTPEAVFRLRTYPWRKTGAAWLKGLALGGAVSRGRTHSNTSFVGAPPTRTFVFFQAVPVNGSMLRTNGEMTWTRGAFGLRAEYDQGRQERRGLDPAKADLAAIVSRGYYVSGTCLLTGEKRPETGQPVPLHALFGKNGGGIGAWELKFRYSGQQMDDGSRLARGDEFSTGFNWYLTSTVNYVFDVNLERLRTPVTSPTPLAPQNFVTILSRMQFRF